MVIVQKGANLVIGNANTLEEDSKIHSVYDYLF